MYLRDNEHESWQDPLVEAQIPLTPQCWFSPTSDPHSHTADNVPTKKHEASALVRGKKLAIANVAYKLNYGSFIFLLFLQFSCFLLQVSVSTRTFARNCNFPIQTGSQCAVLERNLAVGFLHNDAWSPTARESRECNARRAHAQCTLESDWSVSKPARGSGVFCLWDVHDPHLSERVFSVPRPHVPTEHLRYVLFFLLSNVLTWMSASNCS